MQLYAHQQRCLDWIAHKPRAMIGLDQGLGKSAVAALDAVAPVQVVCPASLKRHWANTFKEWRPDLGEPQVFDAKTTIDYTSQVRIGNYDILHRRKWPHDFHTLIGDEGHYIKSTDADRTKRMHFLADRAQRVRLLSGTFMPNRPMELYSPLKLCGATRLGEVDFGRRYASGYVDQWGKWNFRGASNLDELSEKLDTVCFRLTKDEAMPDLPAKLWRVISLDVPIDERERDYNLDAILRTQNVSLAMEGLSQLLKLQGIRKVPLSVKFISEALHHEEQIVVFAWHKEVIAELYKWLSVFGCRVVTGDTPNAQRQEAVDDFQAGKYRVLIGNIQSLGTGFTLTRARRVIFAEGRWSPADMDQAADRCHRIGQTRPVRADILVATDSIDEFMVRRCLEKLRVINQVIKSTNEETIQCPRIPMPSFIRLSPPSPPLA